ncbi:hypothetical protein [Thomasclavelia cocleata]|uniref:hypothetical protein n=1 Tax=Thomasclavelia cocleata TaxID=69824 RepID=UPI002495A3F7|nr:hypothetical protein [Thomasclavelia cocleata]
MEFTNRLRKMTFEGKTYNVLTDEELEDLVIAEVFDKKYKNEDVELIDFEHFVKERETKYDL